MVVNEQVQNPFKPGAGRVPPELAGRDGILHPIREAMNQTIVSSEGERPIIISGLRGVGKTVLLNQIGRQAQDSGCWVVIKMEAGVGRPFSQSLARELGTALRSTMSVNSHARELMGRALRVFRSFQVTVDPSGSYGFGVDIFPERGAADSGVLERDLEDVLREIGSTLRELDRGLLIMIDELQDAPQADLRALNVALHHLGQEPWPPPVFVIGAGLPSLPAELADATSYAERLYDYRNLNLLSREECRDALAVPTERFDVGWDSEALEFVVSSVAGYPYFVQACGKHVWDARITAGRITLDDAQLGVLRARDEIDQGLYRSRWDRATPRQRELMRAMAEDANDSSATQSLIVRMGKKRASDLSAPRNELIKNGYIYAPDRGFLAFTVPGMGDYIRRINTE